LDEVIVEFPETVSTGKDRLASVGLRVLAENRYVKTQFLVTVGAHEDPRATAAGMQRLGAR